jgi:hypothetical protein
MIAPATLAKHWALKSPAQIGTMDVAERFKGAKEKNARGYRAGYGGLRSAICRETSSIAKTLPMQ